MLCLSPARSRKFRGFSPSQQRRALLTRAVPFSWRMLAVNWGALCSGRLHPAVGAVAADFGPIDRDYNRSCDLVGPLNWHG
ncbi:MAG: hypothetical protein ACJAVT_001372 [Yoonia sp.]|jgi:hypothetical protein